MTLVSQCMIATTLSLPPLSLHCFQVWHNDQGLWMVALVLQTRDVATLDLAANVYELPSTQEFIRFLHAALGFPTKSILLKAIRHNNLTSFPGLTTENVNKFFPKSDKTLKKHMHQTRQRVRSTKAQEEEEEKSDFKAKPGKKHKDVYVQVLDMTKQAMYTDQTGQFPIT